MLTALCTALTLALTPCNTSVPPLQKWQAAQLVSWYAYDEERPAYHAVRVIRVSPMRVKVVGHEPGYLCGVGDCEPDVTGTLVERRVFQFWVRDPFTRRWVRRL